MITSQTFLPVEDIKDNLVFLNDGSVSLLITTSAVNFDLLFETEQISIIESFAGLLNSLSFPIQIVISSKRLDVSSYLLTLDQALKSQTNPKLVQIINSYREFVAGIIKENNVLDKQFYIVLNASAMELGILHKNLEQKSKQAAIILSPRKDHLIRQLARLGLKAKQLETIELVKLFYSLYNPQDNETPKKTVAPVVKPPQINVSTLRPLANPILPKTTPAPSPSPTQPNLPLPQPNLPPQTTPVSPPTTAFLTPPFVVEELHE